jgi:CRP/FNR family cyclic AMP-dependent transcriptional regulator
MSCSLSLVQLNGCSCFQLPVPWQLILIYCSSKSISLRKKCKASANLGEANPCRLIDPVHMNTITQTTDTSKARPVPATTAGLSSLVAGHPFLKGLDSHQIRLLTDCSMVVNFKPGETIFREGDPANRFYLINKGTIALESYVEDRGVTPIQTVGAGEVLGWSWLFPPYYWHFDARAVEPVEALFFYATPLRAECEADHDLGYELMSRMADVMMHRLQATRRQLLDLNRCPCKHG